MPAESRPWHMIHLTDPARLFQKLGLDEIRVKESEGEYSLEWKGRRERFSRRQLTKLLFGPERISEIGSDRLPIPVFVPSTDHV